MKLPSGWSTKTLREIGQCIGGLTYSPNEVVDEGEGTLVLRSSNIKHGELAFEDNVFVRTVIPVDAQTREGDILVCVRNGSRRLIGKSALIKGAGIGVIHGAFMLVFRSKYSAFVYQLFQSPRYYKQVRENLGATINSINSSDFYEFKFPFPPEGERSKIVDVLALWDSAIAKTERLILVKNLALRQHQNRLFNNPYWRKLRIADLFSQVTRKVDKLDVPVATISAGKGFMTQQDRFSRVLAGHNLTNYTCLRRGEFAYNKGNSKTYEFGCAYLLTDYPELVIPNVYVSFAPKVPLVPEFYALWFEADLLKWQLRRVVNSGVRNDGLLNINATTFFKLSLPVPSIREQKAISTALLATKEEIAIVKKQLQALKTQKRGLMQKLLTGQWRLKLPESAAV